MKLLKLLAKLRLRQLLSRKLPSEKQPPRKLLLRKIAPQKITSEVNNLTYQTYRHIHTQNKATYMHMKVRSGKPPVQTI